MERPRDRRLRKELEGMHRLMQDSSNVYFKARGDDPEHPEEYIVTFRCLGLYTNPGLPMFLQSDWRKTNGAVSDEHVIYIYLPATWPATPPGIRFQTPVFHPNIKQFPDTPEKLPPQYHALVEVAGGFENFVAYTRTVPDIFAKIFSAFVCIDVLFTPEDGGNYSARLTLYDLCVELGQMIMFQHYNHAHGYNDEAMFWAKAAEQDRGILPVDDRVFLDKLPVNLRGRHQDDDIEISILNEEDE